MGGLIATLVSIEIPSQVVPGNLNCANETNSLFTAFGAAVTGQAITSPYLDISTGQPLFTAAGLGVYSYCTANMPYENVKSVGCSPAGDALVIEDWCSFRPLFGLSTDYDECVAKSAGDICTLESGCGTQKIVANIQQVLCTGSFLLDVTEAGYSPPQRDMLFGAESMYHLEPPPAPAFLCRDLVTNSPPRLSV